MQPSAPATSPSTVNPNMPFGGNQQASGDFGVASSILNFLPQQQNQTAKVNPSDTSILPTVNINAPTFSAPNAPTVNPQAFGNNLTAYNAAVQQATQGLTGSENDLYTQALNEYKKNIAQYGDLTGVYNNLATKFNIPGYEQDVNTLQGLLSNLNQDVNAQTTLGGGLMTEAARDETLANRQQPLDLALASASRSLQTGQGDVANLMQAYETSFSNAIKPEETNLQNLPILFSQNNELASQGFGQGATAIENTIQNAADQQRLALQREQNALYARQVNSEFGNSGSVNGIFGNNTIATPGVGYKDQKQGAVGGYSFSNNGKPTSAVGWATANGHNPAAVIAYMASQGDKTAQAANDMISKSPNGVPISQIVQQFPSLAWDMGMGSIPPSNQSNKSSKTSSGGFNPLSILKSMSIAPFGAGL